ncbi:DUF4321 domain-containing protein [Clostridiaceae bacterium 35-E11]
MRAKNRNPWLLLLLLAVGVVIGGFLGEIFKSSIPILGYGKTIGFQPFTLDLVILKLTLGLMINLNIASTVGIIFAIFIFRRL